MSASVAARLTGQSAVASRHLSSALTQVELDNGTVVVAKRGQGRNATRAEAAGLRWLADSHTVRVPSVRGFDPDWLVIDYVESGHPSPSAAARLGRDLAAMHDSGAPAFGTAPPDGPTDAWIGLAPMRNIEGTDWPAWYAAHRVEPYVRQAVNEGTLHPAEATIIGQVCDRLPELAGPPEPPARLHGDLWSGTVLWGADGHAWLIDPAAHGGHRETDLAMLHLFGCPNLTDVLAGYQEIHPLADGWRERIPLHQLFPLLVHTVLFGRGYANQAVTAANAALRPTQ